MAVDRFYFGDAKLDSLQTSQWQKARKELLGILDLAWIMTLSSIIYCLMFPISLIFVGNLGGTIYLDAIGLGNTVFNVFGILVSNGLMTGCDTTMSQSYGTTNKKMVGVYLQKGLVVYTLVTMVCIAMMLNAETLLVLMGQHREIARLAGDYVTIMAVSALSYGTWNIITRFFRIQNIIWVNIVTCTVTLTTSAIGHYVFITVLGFGIEGSAYAQVLAYLLACASYIVILPLQKQVLRKTWGGFSAECLQEWKTFSVLSFSGLLTVCLQWWGLEICTLMSGRLGEIELGAQTLTFQINYFMYIIPICVGVSCNILIGHHVGANEADLGKLAMRVGWVLTWALSALTVAILLALRNIIPTIFTNNQEVIQMTSDTVPYLALYHVFDCTVTASLGMCRGIARQKMGSCVSFIGIYLIGMPLAIFLTFYLEIGLRGLWLGLTAGLLVETILILVLLLRTDWEMECRYAQIRAGLDPDRKNSGPTGSSFDIPSDERTSLIKTKKKSYIDQPRLTRRFTSEYASSQTDIRIIKSHPGDRLNRKQILFYRGSVILFCLITLILGIVLHLNFVMDYEIVDLCIMKSNYTNNITSNPYPICI